VGSGDGEGVRYAGDFVWGVEVVVEAGLWPATEKDARFLNFSKAEVLCAGPTGCTVVGPPLFENFSSALMRLEMPEDTLTFFATSTWGGGWLFSK